MTTRFGILLPVFLLLSNLALADWPQLQGNALRSGDVPDVTLKVNLGLEAAVPLTDAIQAAPVVKQGVVYVVDGSGVVHAMDIASALQYLNSKNMPHRDVKPHNIFLTAQNNVKIGDLGSSCVINLL